MMPCVCARIDIVRLPLSVGASTRSMMSGRSTPRRRSVADAPRDPSLPLVQADIIFTDKPQVTLYMRFADCVPILLYDSKQSVVGLAHAGWLGTVRGTTTAAVKKMREHYGSKPENILAAIGPSIGVDHYEIGHDVVAKVHESFNSYAERLLQSRDGKTYFDLWAANALQLQQSGVDKIEIAGLCRARYAGSQ